MGVEERVSYRVAVGGSVGSERGTWGGGIDTPDRLALLFRQSRVWSAIPTWVEGGGTRHRRVVEGPGAGSKRHKIWKSKYQIDRRRD